MKIYSISMRKSFGGIFAAVLHLLVMYPAYATDVTLNVRVQAVDEKVNIEILNSGKDTAQDVSGDVELNSRHYSLGEPIDVSPGTSISRSITVVLPEQIGAYPLITSVRYTNDRNLVGVLDVGTFHFKESAGTQNFCLLPTIYLRDQSTISLNSGGSSEFRFVFPEGITQKNIDAGIELTNTSPMLSTNSNYFRLKEGVGSDAKKVLSLCRGNLLTVKQNWAWSGFSDPSLLFLSSLSFLAAWILWKRGAFGGDVRRKLGIWGIALTRAFFSLFVISTLFLFSRKAGALADLLLPFAAQIQTAMFRDAFEVVLRMFYFQGGDYDYFFQYVSDSLLCYFIFGNIFFLALISRPDPEHEKNCHLIRFVFSLLEGKFVWSKETRVAILALCVKVFYVPLLMSWATNDIFYQQVLINEWHGEFYFVNKFLVATFIFIDVLFFAVGYVLEIPRLQNVIRSVEPTFFGWFICLLCYPPFNQTLFHFIDTPIVGSPHEVIPYAKEIGTVLITILWGIYCSATVALGFRSSNLTNRGIVCRGPYAFIRHPAYVSKVTLWCVTWAFLGTMNFTLSLTLVVVYALRAWTEERHLSQDEDYLLYKQKVPWLIVPKVW